MERPTRDAADLLAEARVGNQESLEQLTLCVYTELRRIAAVYLRHERANHTLQPTALVHEAYMRLIGAPHQIFENRAHFFRIAARQMRRILIDHARNRRREKRGGSCTRVTLDENAAVEAGRDVDVLALDEALHALAAKSPALSNLVELRHFGGLTTKETAEVLGVSTATVERDWAMAKSWLLRFLTEGAPA